MKTMATRAAALGLLMALAGAAPAADDDASARRDLERARQELNKARAELQRATRELARSMAKLERDNPRAQYFEYMTNPDRAVLGVIIPDDMENGEERGVRVLAVTPGSGADKAGLKAGDLLTVLNGQALARDGKRSPQKRLREAMKAVKAGDEVKVEYERDGRRQTAAVTTQGPEPEIAMGHMPMIEEWLHDEHFPKMPHMPPMFHRSPTVRGMELAKLDEDLGSYFKTTEGVLVVKAPKNSALGLKSGDVIQKIDGAPVREPITVLDRLRTRSQEQTVRIDIVRQGRKMELEAKIPTAEGPRRPSRPRAAEAVAGPDDEGT